MARTIAVHEHQPIAVGTSARELRPHEFDALVSFNDHHRGEFFEVGHRRLRTRHFVGYLEVGDVAIEILPKADKHAAGESQPWREGLLEMLRVAGGLALHRLPDASQRLSRRPLIEIIAQAYLAELALLLHEGLARGYRTVESNRTVFRGRLKVTDHIRANLVRADRFYVEYPIFDQHIPINRVLLAALDVLSWCALSPRVSAEVDATMARFPDLAIAGVDAAMVDRLHLTRATQRYQAALTYARMILARQGPHLRAGRERVFALLFDMNTLWERYVAVLAHRVAPHGARIHTQERHAFWRPRHHGTRSVRPDIVVRDATERATLVIDTKWKVPGKGLPSDDDLKQMFVYNELLGCERSILLYPGTAQSFAAGGTYADRTHECMQRHLGLFEDGHWSTHVIMEQLRSLLEYTATPVPG